MTELNINLNENLISQPILIDLHGIDTISIDRSKVGAIEERNHNLYGFARRNRHIKNLVTTLTNNGFYIIKSENGNSIFKKFLNAESFIKHIQKPNLQYHKSIFYTLKKPILMERKNRLLICFSSVSDRPYDGNIGNRNFVENFKSIAKYIPKNTYILRIADIGGVVGSFYVNNNYNENVEIDIQSLIKHISTQYFIHPEDIVLYGTSKGGTGSLYHAVLGHYKCVSVDPILTGAYHYNQLNDVHFTEGTFPKTKKESFNILLSKHKIHTNINIIYSDLSPITSEIQDVILNHQCAKKINLFNVFHSEIKSHPDVGMNSVNLLLLIINSLFYNLGPNTSHKISL